MNPKLYPKVIPMACEWCGAIEHKTVAKKDDIRTLHFCSGTDHKELYNHKARNRKEMMGLTCSKYYRKDSVKKKYNFAKQLEAKNPDNIWEPTADPPRVSSTNEEYLQALRKHKMNTCNSSQAMMPFPINERTTKWENQND